MRLTLPTPLMSRDGTVTKDPHMRNCFAEVKGKSSVVVKRPGLLEAYDTTAGAAQGTVCWNGTLYSFRNNQIVQGPTELPIADGSLWEQDSDIGISSYSDSADSIRVALLGTTVYLIHNSSPRGLWKSTDGLTFTAWTPSGLPTVHNGRLHFFTHNGYLYFSQSENGGIATPLYRSSDGETWTQVTAAMGWVSAYETVGFVSDGTNLYAVSPNSTASVWKSTNGGASFTQITAASGLTGSAWGCVFFGNKLWHFGGTSVHSSTDGITWALATASPGWADHSGRCFGLVYSTKMWCFIPRGSYLAPGVGYVEVWTSADGITWDQENSGIPFQSYYGSGYGCSSFAGAVPYGGTVYSYGTRYISGYTVQPQRYEATITSAGGQLYTIAATSLPINAAGTSLNAATEYLFLKTTADAWVLTFGEPGTLTQVTDADYPATTVPGVAYLDGYVFVMDAAGTIYNCDLELPLAWNSLNYITAESDSDEGKAIAKHQNYIVAFKDQTIEYFYDSANATGSPLTRMATATVKLGCADGRSLASSDGALFFVSKTVSAARSVHTLPANSLVPVEIADENVRRILTNSTFTNVAAWAARLGGHAFYVLVLKDSNLTLAYDVTTTQWSLWTYLTAMTPITLTSLTQSGGIATATYTAHGFTDGTPTIIAGATPSGYNGTFNITVTDADHFTYEVDSSLTATATGTITATSHTEGYFPFPYFTSCGGSDFVQHESNGKLYEIGLNHTDDAGQPIDVRLRLAKVDNKTLERKVHNSLRVVGDQVDGNLLVRYTDDDYQTVSAFRQVSLNSDTPRLRRLGDTRRRAYELRYTEDTTLRLAAIELE